MTQRPRSIPASASIFFARLFLFLRYLTFLFFRDAPSSRRLLLHRPPSPNDPGGSVLSLAVRERKRDREPSSLSSSCRVRVYSRPILSRRRHFAPFIDPAPTHSPAFPATFLSPDKPAACISCSPTVPSLRLLHQQNIAGFRIAVARTERLVQVATVRELIRLCSLSSTRSRTRFEPICIELRRTGLKRRWSERERTDRCMEHSAPFMAESDLHCQTPSRAAALGPLQVTPSELQRSSAGFCRTLQIFRPVGIGENPLRYNYDMFNCIFAIVNDTVSS